MDFKKLEQLLKPISEYNELLLSEAIYRRDFADEIAKNIELKEKEEHEKNLKEREKEYKRSIKEYKNLIKFYVLRYIPIVKKKMVKNILFIPDVCWLSSDIMDLNLNNSKENLTDKQIKDILRLINFRLHIKKKNNRKSVPKELRDKIFQRDKGICQICKCNLNFKNSAWEVDHINENPADSNDITNLRILCRKCNRKPRRANK